MYFTCARNNIIIQEKHAQTHRSALEDTLPSRCQFMSTIDLILSCWRVLHARLHARLHSGRIGSGLIHERLRFSIILDEGAAVTAPSYQAIRSTVSLDSSPVAYCLALETLQDAATDTCELSDEVEETTLSRCIRDRS